MTATESWTYTNRRTGATLALNDDVALRLTGRSGFGAPPATMQARRAPYQRGASFLSGRATIRTLSLRLAVLGATLTATEATLRNLAEVLDPGVAEPGDSSVGYLTVIRADGAIRQLDCCATDGLEFERDSDTGPGFTRIAPTFTAYDPYWYDPAGATVTFTGSGAGLSLPLTLPFTLTLAGTSVGVPALVTNAGTAPAEPVFTIQGPMISPVLMNLTTGKTWTLNYTLPASSTLTVDTRFGQKSATLVAYGSSFNVLDYVTSDSEFWSLVPGVNTVLITNTAPHPGGDATISYAPRFIAL